MDSADMSRHLEDGTAVPLSAVVPFIARYHDTWWLSTQAGWLPIAPPIAAVLDEHAERMRQHDAMIAANQATIRAIIDIARNSAKHEQQPPA
jgi:hypothetical protein